MNLFSFEPYVKLGRNHRNNLIKKSVLCIVLMSLNGTFLAHSLTVTSSINMGKTVLGSSIETLCVCLSFFLTAIFLFKVFSLLLPKIAFSTE